MTQEVLTVFFGSPVTTAEGEVVPTAGRASTSFTSIPLLNLGNGPTTTGSSSLCLPSLESYECSQAATGLGGLAD